MIDVRLACEFIPGYDLLTEPERLDFEKTLPGKLLAIYINKLEKNTIWKWLTSDDNKIKTELMSIIATDRTYITLLTLIEAEKNRRRTLYFPYLQTACEHQISVMNLDTFNAQQAESLAAAPLNDQASLANWLELYQQTLLMHMKNNMGLINGRDPLKDPLMYTEIRESLSYLLSHGIFKEGKDLLDKLADAHGFIQATGFATQNETSSLVWLDIYNYTRAIDQIGELRFTINRFLEPFTPLFAEYYDITHQEHNVALQIIRTIIPMLIISATVIIVSAFLTQFVIPELAFIFILIPTIYIGLILATSYVVTKDSIYHTVRQYYYGGPFEIPEYQINKRMADGFGQEARAQMVRDFYVTEISACFEKELGFRQKMAGTKDYTEEERRENTARLGKLQLEWYDIHSNTKLGCDQIPQIIINRLRVDIKQACESIKREIPSQLETEIRPLVTEIVHEIQASIEGRGHQHRFFTQPKCFEHKTRAESLNAKLQLISAF